MPEQIIRIAVMSDLHCTHEKNDKSTYLHSDLCDTPINQNPIESLKQLIEKEELSTDILLCPGDITDRINKQGFVSGWQYILSIKNALKSKNLIATVGNHDLDSRGGNYNKIGKNLNKDYPYNIDEFKEKFWSQNFFVLDLDEIIVLVFNSSFTHTTKEKAEQSIITTEILEAIEIELTKTKDSEKFKVAMCHHHPIKFSNMDELYKDGDVLEKGDHFLDLLEKYNFHLIVHGHKHIPNLIYRNSLPIFCAGSFSSLANLHYWDKKNTFHIIEFSKIHKKSIIYVNGIIKTWEYSYTKGWTRNQKNVFPCLTGFGYTGSIDLLAEDCANWFYEQNMHMVNFTELLKFKPDVQYLIPTYQEKFVNFMREKYKLQFHPTFDNAQQIIRIEI